MKALVTGGAGFIGSNLVDALVVRGDDVVVYDDFSTGFRGNLKHHGFNNRVTIINGEIGYKDYLIDTCKNVDVIYHLAARISVPESINDPTGTHKVNVDGTLAVLEAARANGCRVVFASSSAVYGDQPKTLRMPKSYYENEDNFNYSGIEERSDKRPCSPYGVSKLIGEELCDVYSRCYKVPTTCLRFFNVYGPRQNVNNGYAAAIPKFINCLLKDESPVIYGDGNQTRSFTYIDDIVSALLLAGSNNTHPINLNISTYKTTSINTLARHIKSILGKEHLENIYKEKRDGDILHSLADTSKAKFMLGFVAKVDLGVGLRKTVDYYKNNIVV